MPRKFNDKIQRCYFNPHFPRMKVESGEVWFNLKGWGSQLNRGINKNAAGFLGHLVQRGYTTAKLTPRQQEIYDSNRIKLYGPKIQEKKTLTATFRGHTWHTEVFVLSEYGRKRLEELRKKRAKNAKRK